MSELDGSRASGGAAVASRRPAGVALVEELGGAAVMLTRASTGGRSDAPAAPARMPRGSVTLAVAKHPLGGRHGGPLGGYGLPWPCFRPSWTHRAEDGAATLRTRNTARRPAYLGTWSATPEIPDAQAPKPARMQRAPTFDGTFMSMYLQVVTVGTRSILAASALEELMFA